MNRRELITMVAGGTITPFALKAMTPTITENQIKDVFRKNGFHVTPSNAPGAGGLFCVEWGDMVTDFSPNGKYMKYVIARENGEVAPYLDFNMKEYSSCIFSNLDDLNTHIIQHEAYNDYMSFIGIYELSSGYLLRYVSGCSDQFYNGPIQPWANPAKYFKLRVKN